MKRFFLALAIASFYSGASAADNYIRLPVKGMHGAAQAQAHPATAKLNAGQPPGTGKKASISLSTSSLSFGELNVGQVSGTQIVTVTNSGSVEGTLAVSTAGAFAVTEGNCAATLAAGATCNIGLAFQPTAPGRTLTGNLTVASSDGTKVVALSAAAKLAAYPQLSMTATPNPDWLYLVGKTYAYMVTVTNVGSMAATLGTSTIAGQIAGENTLVTSGRGLVLPCGAQLAVGSSCYLYPRFTPSVEAQSRAPAVVTLPNNATNAYGEQTAQSITIDESSPSRNGALIASYKGGYTVSAAEAAEGFTLNSGLTNIGNVGTLVKSIHQVSGGAVQFETNCVGTTLTAYGGSQAYCAFSVYAPSTPGTHTFVWAVESDSMKPTTIEVTWTVTP